VAAWQIVLLVLLIVVWGSLLISKFRKGRIMAVVWSVLLVIFITYSILGWSLYFMQPQFLYRPTKEVLYNPGDMGLGYEKIVFTNDNETKLTGWFIPAENAELTILFCHGNGGNIAHRLDSINIFNELGLNCFIFDYSGYGQSQGKPSEQATYFDAQAAYDWLTKNKKVDPQNIIIFGRSLGGCIAANLASRVQPKSLILESSFTSYIDMGKKFYPYMPVKLFAAFNYNTLEYLRDVRCPVMIIHSRSDELIPFELGLKLYDAALEPKEFVEIFGTHNDGFLYSGETYKQAWTQWLQFLKEHSQVTKPTLKRIS